MAVKCLDCRKINSRLAHIFHMVENIRDSKEDYMGFAMLVGSGI